MKFLICIVIASICSISIILYFNLDLFGASILGFSFGVLAALYSLRWKGY